MSIQEVGLVLGIAGLALWRRAMPFYIMAFFACYFIGGMWFAEAWQYGVGAWLLAFFLLSRAIKQAAEGNIET